MESNREYKTWISKIAHQHNHGAALARFGTYQWHSQFGVESWFRSGTISMSQDQITTLSIWLAGYTRLQTIVNRVIHIGKEGISSKNHTLDIQLDEFPEEEVSF